jgi:battenin
MLEGIINFSPNLILKMGN